MTKYILYYTREGGYPTKDEFDYAFDALEAWFDMRQKKKYSELRVTKVVETDLFS